MNMKIWVILTLGLVFLQLSSHAGYPERVKMLMDKLADEYQPPSMNIGDPEKYYWPKTIARFEKYGINDELANSYIDTFRLNSPFHFTLVGMARIMSAYPDAPSVKQHKIEYLNKVFERTDSYNPWTGEGTENHIAMSRTSGYLFAQHALEYPEVFPQARLRLQQMELWITLWAKRLFEIGNGEWNSDIYEVYNLIGWLNLYDFADNEEIRSIARAVLDFYATELALHYSWGLTGGTAMRGSGAGFSRYNASNYLGWLWFGTTSGFPFGFRGNQYIQMVHPMTSAYAPPEEIVNLGKKKMELPSYYKTSRPSYLMGKPSFVKQFFYVTNEYSLGSSVSPYGGWTGSTWQMVNWRLVIRSNKEGMPHAIGGNGRFYNEWSGKTTNPFTQVVQHKNVLIQITKTPENVESIVQTMQLKVKQWSENWERDFRKRFPHDHHKRNQGVVNFGGRMIKENTSYLSFPEDARIKKKDSLYMVELANVQISVIPIQSVMDVNEIKTKNETRLILMDKAPLGQACGFIIEVFNKNELTQQQKSALSEMKGMVQADHQKGKVTYKSVSGNEITAGYVESGWFREATVDWGYGVEAPKIMMSYPDFRQPKWPSGEGYGRIPHLEVNNKRIEFDDYWPLYDGDEVEMKNKILEIKIYDQKYQVRFTSDAPVFSD